jgi:hypothetical protein
VGGTSLRMTQRNQQAMLKTARINKCANFFMVFLFVRGLICR